MKGWKPDVTLSTQEQELAREMFGDAVVDDLKERLYEHMDNMLTGDGADEINTAPFGTGLLGNTSVLDEQHIILKEMGERLDKEMTENADMVNSPAHYNTGNIETIDAIEESMSAEGFCDYLKGNIMKYIWRYRDKGGLQDLKKAEWYLQRLIRTREKIGDS